MTREQWLEDLAQEAARRGLVDVSYDQVDTSIGRLLVATSDTGVCRVAFAEESSDEVLEEIAGGLGARIVRSRSSNAPVTKSLVRYLDGKVMSLDFPVDFTLMHAPFRRRVLEELQKVPRGEVVTYRALAGRAGRPRAVRAAGSACATNPVPIIVPCHRVVPTGGGVGNYGGGPDRKRFLLQLEGAL